MRPKGAQIKSVKYIVNNHLEYVDSDLEIHRRSQSFDLGFEITYTHTSINIFTFFNCVSLSQFHPQWRTQRGHLYQFYQLYICFTLYPPNLFEISQQSLRFRQNGRQWNHNLPMIWTIVLLSYNGISMSKLRNRKKSNLALIFIHIEGFLDVKMMAFESHHNYRKIYKQLHPPSNET